MTQSTDLQIAQEWIDDDNNWDDEIHDMKIEDESVQVQTESYIDLPKFLGRNRTVPVIQTVFSTSMGVKFGTKEQAEQLKTNLDEWYQMESELNSYYQKDDAKVSVFVDDHSDGNFSISIFSNKGTKVAKPNFITENGIMVKFMKDGKYF